MAETNHYRILVLDQKFNNLNQNLNQNRTVNEKHETPHSSQFYTSTFEHPKGTYTFIGLKKSRHYARFQGEPFWSRDLLFSEKGYNLVIFSTYKLTWKISRMLNYYLSFLPPEIPFLVLVTRKKHSEKFLEKTKKYFRLKSRDDGDDVDGRVADIATPLFEVSDNDTPESFEMKRSDSEISFWNLLEKIISDKPIRLNDCRLALETKSYLWNVFGAMALLALFSATQSWEHIKMSMFQLLGSENKPGTLVPKNIYYDPDIPSYGRFREHFSRDLHKTDGDT